MTGSFLAAERDGIKPLIEVSITLNVIIMNAVPAGRNAIEAIPARLLTIALIMNAAR